jgi:type II secretory pathway pseudopilin PulG
MRAGTISGRRDGQRGALMAGLMAAVAILAILSLLAFQEWADVLRRDSEAEMMFRAQDIVRAIQRYRKEHGGAGPQKLEDLLEPGQLGQYYLRRLYEDPLVKDGKWGLLFQGPGGTIIDPSIEGAEPIQPGPGERRGPAARRLAAADRQRAGSAPAQRPGAVPGGPTAAAPGSATGLPIAGVKSLSTDRPFREYKGMSDYSQWLFTYLDLEGAGGAGRVTGRGRGQTVGSGFNETLEGQEPPQPVLDPQQN